MAIGGGLTMRRRNFIAGVGGAGSWLSVAWAQQPLPVIGFLNASSAQSFAPQHTAFLKGLAEEGFIEGRNVTIEYRWADGHNDRLPTMAADLVQRRVSVIAATTTAASLAAKAATTTIPIVFETSRDPVQLGLVATLSRPGGNVTGVTQTNIAIEPKQLELLHELVPAATVMALLVDPAGSGASDEEVGIMQAAARTLGLELQVVKASHVGEFEGVFAQLRQLKVGGIVIGADVLFSGHTQQLAELAAKHGVPAVYKGREFVAEGGLASYGTDLTEYYRLAGSYTGRVLKGQKPAELAVLQATRVQLYINLKTAKTLGISVPLSLAGRADEAVE
jgi:putative ABC transport system substrate-binding protein